MEESGATTAFAAPPPLPPKTRRSATGVTALTTSAAAVATNAVGATGLIGGAPSGCAQQPLSSISSSGEHVVKIRINPDTSATQTGSIRISVGGSEPEDMVRRPADAFIKQPHSNPYFFCSSFPSSGMVISSGQSSPSDTLDSGTCSDLDGSTPPPLPKKNGVSAVAAAAAAAAAATVTVTVNGSHPQHRRTGSLTSSGAEADSDEDAHSNISCDSLNSHELSGLHGLSNGLNGGGDLEDTNNTQYSFSKMVLNNCHHKHNETTMESIQEEKIISPPSPPLKSVALTVRANNLVNNPITAPVAPMIAATAATVTTANTTASVIHTPTIVNGNNNIVTFNGSVTTTPSPVTAPIITNGTPKPPPPKTPAKPFKSTIPKTPPSPTGQKTFLPQGLLQDIRDRTATLTGVSSTPGSPGQRKFRSWSGDITPPKTSKSPSPEPKELTKNPSSLYRILSAEHGEPSTPKPARGFVQERTYEERVRERNSQEAASVAGRPRTGSYKYEEDRFYHFHLNEREPEPENPAAAAARTQEEEEETFAGLKDIMGAKEGSATIRSAKGTVRGVKNRVRAGIATFLHYPDTKNYKEKEAGKVVLYVTTMGIVRHTFQECLKVKKILRTLLVKYEERDAFMSREVQNELRERMHSDQIQVPQLFVEGQHIGDAETIERLNETGELRKMLKPFKSPDVCNTCQVCGGFRLLPCSICNGSKKSMHRNDFTAEFVALKCMSCDEVGLVKCHAC